jgi:hypothetical protein
MDISLNQFKFFAAWGGKTNLNAAVHLCRLNDWDDV